MPAPTTRLLRWALVPALLIVTPWTAVAEPTRTTYQEIEISWPDEFMQERLRDIPGLEIMGVDPGESIRLVSTPDQTSALESAGFRPRVIHGDLQAHYAARNGTVNRGGGNFGLLYTFDEAVAELDALHAEFPNILTDKMSIGTSIEGRDIWAVKISDNPTIEEPGEPEVLFDALHHARESITPSVLLGYMRYLCENYGTDPEATYIVDNRQTWFVPVVNPDGYVYNESLDPNGGGMWRKNRRDNPGSCEGVDLNRNYSYEFGGPGSESDMCSDIYRGPSPFSEPETSAMRDFMIAHEFVTHDSYHSVVATVLVPWGYTNVDAPDRELFNEIAAERVRDNGYGYGTAFDELNYLASGVTFDYAYGNTTDKPQIIAFTTEVGGSGFWPQDSEVAGLVAENIYSNIYLSLVAGSFLRIESATVQGGDGNGRLDAGETAEIVVEVKNVGVLVDASAITVTLASNDPYVSFVDAEASIADLAAGATGDNAADPFAVSVDPATPDGHRFDFAAHIEWIEGTNSTVAQLIVGAPATLSFQDFEDSDGGWSVDPASTASTGAWERIDPNPTNYQPDDDTTPPPGVFAMITAQNVSDGNNDVDNGIAGLLSPTYDFSAEASIEVNLNFFFGQRDPGDDAADFFRIDLSNDGGASFPANLLTIGDGARAPVWEAFSARLDDHLPLTSQMVLRVQASDGPTAGDIIEAGIDDVVFFAGDGNEAPSAPLLVSPADGAAVDAEAELVVANAIDPEGESLTYAFTVYGDDLLTDVARSVSGIPEGALETTWTIAPPLADGVYFWRAYAEDPTVRGDYSATRSFTVGDIVGVPDVASAIALAAPSPNPFRAATSLRFVLPEPALVRADVFDVTGRHVRSLHRGLLPEGPQTVVWDGLDRAGRDIGTGEYFLQIAVDGRVFTRKVIAID